MAYFVPFLVVAASRNCNIVNCAVYFLDAKPAANLKTLMISFHFAGSKH